MRKLITIVITLFFVVCTGMHLYAGNLAYADESYKAEIITAAGLNVDEAVNILYEADQKKLRNQRKKDIESLAHLVNAENACHKARLYTGSVVLNRVNSDIFPDSIDEVIWQRGQYACTWDGHYEWEPDQDAYEVAEYLIDNGSVIPDNVLMAAEFIQGEIYDEIEGTYYCYYD